MTLVMQSMASAPLLLLLAAGWYRAIRGLAKQSSRFTLDVLTAPR